MHPQNTIRAFFVSFILALAIPCAYGADITKAWTLYKEAKYLESSALSSIETEEGIYLLWLNEVEIGGLAGPMSDDPSDSTHKFLLYVKANPSLFYHSESIAAYRATNHRFHQLEAKNSKSPYLGKIQYRWIVEFDESAWEDGDGSMHSKELISKYEDLLKRYPDATFASKAKTRILEIKKFHKLRTGTEFSY